MRLTNRQVMAKLADMETDTRYLLSMVDDEDGELAQAIVALADRLEAIRFNMHAYDDRT